MVDTEVLIEKVNSIQNCLHRIHQTMGKQPNALDDLNVQDVVVLNLQRAVQLAIDMAFHVISDEGLGMPQNLKDSFKILKDNKIIDPSLCEKMEKMVGFRNIAVHDYQSINPEILKKITEYHLQDIECFYTQILSKYRG